MNLKTRTIDNPDFIGTKLLDALQQRFEQLSMTVAQPTPAPAYARSNNAPRPGGR